MKCLTSEESEEWLTQSGVLVEGHRNLQFRAEQERVMTTMPKRVSALNGLSIRLAHWVTGDVGRILWLSHWETHPPEPLIQFETMRLACGEGRSIIDSPGHLFEQSSEQENAILAGLIFLTMAFNWEGYLVTQRGDEFIYLGDEHIVFSSADRSKMKEVSELIRAFDLEAINDIRQAWG